MCSGEDEAPGPPLNRNITGRSARAFTPSRTYAIVVAAAEGLPAASSRKISATVAV